MLTPDRSDRQRRRCDAVFHRGRVDRVRGTAAAGCRRTGSSTGFRPGCRTPRRWYETERILKEHLAGADQDNLASALDDSLSTWLDALKKAAEAATQ